MSNQYINIHNDPPAISAPAAVPSSIRPPITGLSHLIILLTTVCFFLACKRAGCPLTSGSSGSEGRDLAPFHAITLYGKVNIILTQDSLQQVRLEGGKNLLPGISTTVYGQTLTVKDNNACLLSDPSGRVDLYISVPQLQKITYYGAGDVHSTNTIRASQFTVDCWEGSGTIRLDVQATDINALARNENMTIVLTGTADSSYIYGSDAGSVDMSGCTTNATEIDTKSVRDISVDATRALHAHILYRGNVFYRSEPAVIDTRITSTGKLIHTD